MLIHDVVSQLAEWLQSYRSAVFMVRATPDEANNGKFCGTSTDA